MKPQGSSINKPGSKYSPAPVIYNWSLFKTGATDQYAYWHFLGIHYQNCTKLQGTNSHKLPVLVMRSKEEVQY
jgi:hypothetical protein